MPIEKLALPYSETADIDLRSRLAQTRWPDSIPGTHWEYGADLAYVRELCHYWSNQFDWQAQLDQMAAFAHFKANIEGIGVHFIHERGQGPAPMPIVLTHGWPGSFLEFVKLIPLLTDPESHGGVAEDSFDVIVPSLPGFGFSDRPAQPGMNTFRIAELWAGLMSELGYQTFAAQGGDFGASVSTVLGLRHAQRMIGIHLNYIPGSYRPYLAAGAALSAIEQDFLHEDEQWYVENGAYSHVQELEPQTLAFALNDSPAGLAAWIMEKFRDWADCGGDLETRFTKDELLANITLYWMTETIHSSCRLYYEVSQAPLHFGLGEFVQAPCAIARFAKESPFPPRPWVERGYNIQRWTDLPTGGHFAAAEEPQVLAADIRAFFRGLRTGKMVSGLKAPI